MTAKKQVSTKCVPVCVRTCVCECMCVHVCTYDKEELSEEGMCWKSPAWREQWS